MQYKIYTLALPFDLRCKSGTFTDYINWYGLHLIAQEGHCIDDVNDVQQGGNNFTGLDKVVIVPRLKFTCFGKITNIKVGINSIKNGSFPSIQIWRPSPPSQVYSLVDKVQIQSSHLNTQSSYIEANINNINMHFLSGDVIGFYIPPDSGYVIRDTATDGYDYYIFVGSDATKIDLNTGITSNRRQPLIQFTLGEYDDN